MILLSDPQRQTLQAAVQIAQAVPDLVARIHAIYADVQTAIDARKPRCDVSGKCCQFEKFGHLLFVTTLELAAFAAQRPEWGPSLDTKDGTTHADGGGCRYQIGGLCTVHTIRPFGCRIYFCDPTAEDWQHEQYEAFHTRLKALHDELAVPYLYVEWRQGLRAISDSLCREYTSEAKMA